MSTVLRCSSRPLGPEVLDARPFAAPFLALDLAVVEAACARLQRALPRVGIHYAVTCNPEPALLARLAAIGSGFEIASLAELASLVALGIDPRRVLSSNPVKHAAQIAGAWRLGVDRFAADSRCELAKLAAEAPGSRVYVRLDAADPASRVPLACSVMRAYASRFNGFEIPTTQIVCW
jgi:ornithine decarboxylase